MDKKLFVSKLRVLILTSLYHAFMCFIYKTETSYINLQKYIVVALDLVEYNDDKLPITSFSTVAKTV